MPSMPQPAARISPQYLSLHHDRLHPPSACEEISDRERQGSRRPDLAGAKARTTGYLTLLRLLQRIRNQRHGVAV